MARHTRGSNLGKGYAGKGGMSSDHPKVPDMGRGKKGAKHMMPSGKMMLNSEMDEMVESKKSAHKGRYHKGAK